MIDRAQIFRDQSGTPRPIAWLLLLAIITVFIGLLVLGILPPAHDVLGT